MSIDSPAVGRSVPAGLAVPLTVDARLVGFALLADLLFLPHFPWLIMPFGLPLVMLWALTRTRVRLSFDLQLFLVLAVCVIASAALSLFFADRGVAIDNIKRAGQLVSTFAYYFAFRALARRTRFDPTPILLAFLVYHTAWALFYYAAPQSATAWVVRVYPATLPMAEANLVFFRFAYMFTDPNTAGYLVVTAAGYVLSFGRRTRMSTIVALIAILVGTAVTGSRGVILVVAIMGAWWLFRNPVTAARHASRYAHAALLAIALAAGAAAAYSKIDPQAAGRVWTMASVSLKRIGGSEGTIGSALFEGDTSAGAHRFERYSWLALNRVPLPLGRGYTLLDDEGQPVPPHSDIMRMIYSYGFVACAALVVFLFRDIGRMPFALVAFMAFAVNSLIDEQKVFGTFLVLLAVARVETERWREGVEKPVTSNSPLDEVPAQAS